MKSFILVLLTLVSASAFSDEQIDQRAADLSKTLAGKYHCPVSLTVDAANLSPTSTAERKEVMSTLADAEYELRMACKKANGAIKGLTKVKLTCGSIDAPKKCGSEKDAIKVSVSGDEMSMQGKYKNCACATGLAAREVASALKSLK